MNPVKAYLAAIGRKGGQKSRRKLTKAQARAMVRARTAKRAALRPNNKVSHTAGRKPETEGKMNAAENQKPLDGANREAVLCSSDLLACPFCGRQPEIISRGYHDGGKWVDWISLTCNASKGGCGCSQSAPTDSEVIYRWNHRAEDELWRLVNRYMTIPPASEECKECYDELRAYWANRAGVSPAEPDEMELCPVCHGTNEGTDGPPCPKCDNTGDVPRQANM